MPNGNGTPPLLIDTHIWFWIIEGTTSRMSAHALEEVNLATADGRLLVSAMSVWEIAMLESRHRITMSHAITEWVREALRAPGTRLLELSPAIAIESTRLPGTPHGDPADRILMASARVSGARLATCDTSILGYARSGHLAALDARP